MNKPLTALFAAILMFCAYIYRVGEYQTVVLIKQYSTPDALAALIPQKDAPLDSDKFQPNRIHIFAAASDRTPRRLCKLVRSLCYFNANLNVLGFNASTKFFDGTPATTGPGMDTFLKRTILHYQVFHKKTFWYRHLLFNAEKLGIGPDDLLVFLDSYDIVAQRDLSELSASVSRMLKNRRGIIFGVEKGCYPFPSRRAKHTRYFVREGRFQQRWVPKRGYEMCPILAQFASNPASPYKYINSGTYVGDLVSLRKFFQLTSGLIDNLYHDQEMPSIILAQRRTDLNIVLDSDSEIFFGFDAGFSSQELVHVSDRLHDCLISYRNTIIPKLYPDIGRLGKVQPPVLNYGWNESLPFFLHFYGGTSKTFLPCTDKIYPQTPMPNLRNCHSFRDIDRNLSVFYDKFCTMPS